MNIRDFTRLGLKHTQHLFSETMYLKTGFDITQPVTFYAIVNERCNAKCRHCGYWRMEHYEPELSTEEWQNALLSLKEWLGSYSINFSGGEPFLRKDITDILNFCYKNGIYSGVTTNGSALTATNVKKTVAAHPFNVNISCDAPNAKVHDYFRGMPGSFDRLSRGIELLLEEREAQGAKFPIIIKPTISSLNCHLLGEIVEWAKKIGVNAINFQPIEHWTSETYDELWVEEESLPKLEEAIEQLIDMKNKGAPVLNTIEMLRLMVPYFRSGGTLPRTTVCLTGTRNYFIRTNGNVELCYFFPTVGNVKDKSARQIWYGEEAKTVREKTIKCDKPCLTNCLYQNSLGDKVKKAVKLLAKR